MNKQLFIATTVASLVLSLVTGCQKSSDRQNNTAEVPTTIAEGSSSGGGSFGDESSMTILRWAADDLSGQIQNASRQIFKALPNGWTQQQLADVIRNVRPIDAEREKYKIPDVSRHGQRLMFDYRQDNNGKPFLTATRLFIDAYSHYDVNTRPKHEFYYTIEEVKLKLVHEAAHLLGLGVTKESDMTEARVFAKSLLQALDSDNFECLPSQPASQYIYTAFEVQGMLSSISVTAQEKKSEKTAQILAKKTRAYVFNRPSGRAAVPSNALNTPAISCQPKSDGTADCTDQTFDHGNSPGYITVFSPRSMDENFNLNTVRASILEGKREYGFKEGYFSWNLIDLRKAVATPEGYRSNYKWGQPYDINSNFDEYQDYKVTLSTPEKLELESYPHDKQENWNYYRSLGQAKIQIQFKNEKIQAARLLVTKNFNLWIESTENADLNVSVPLTCIHSFKPLEIPGKYIDRTKIHKTPPPLSRKRSVAASGAALSARSRASGLWPLASGLSPRVRGIGLWHPEPGPSAAPILSNCLFGTIFNDSFNSDSIRSSIARAI